MCNLYCLACDEIPEVFYDSILFQGGFCSQLLYALNVKGKRKKKRCGEDKTWMASCLHAPMFAWVSHPEDRSINKKHKIYFHNESTGFKAVLETLQDSSREPTTTESRFDLDKYYPAQKTNVPHSYDTRLCLQKAGNTFFPVRTPGELGVQLLSQPWVTAGFFSFVAVTEPF